MRLFLVGPSRLGSGPRTRKLRGPTLTGSSKLVVDGFSDDGVAEIAADACGAGALAVSVLLPGAPHADASTKRAAGCSTYLTRRGFIIAYQPQEAGYLQQN